MKRHTLVCPPGFVEQFGKCVPEGNRPDGTRADLVSGNVVPFIPDNVPGGGGGGGDDGFDYRGLYDKASTVLRYAGMSKKIYDSQQSLEEEMRRYELGAGEAEEGTEVIMFGGPEEAPLTTEELRLRALTKQYREAEEYEDVAAATEKYEAEQEYNAIIQKMEEDALDNPLQTYADQLDANFDPRLNEPPVPEDTIPSLEELKTGGVGKNPIPDIAGQYGGDLRPPLDDLPPPPDVPSRPPTFAPIDELPPDVPVAGYGPEFTDLHSAIVDKGTKSIAMEATEAEAKEAIAAARAAGTAVSLAEEADIMRTVIAAAQAGEDADVAALIMGGLVSGGVASIGAVAAVGAELAIMTAVNAGAEYALKKAGFGLPDRPKSLDSQGAHTATPEEIAYFKALNKNELDTFDSSDKREKAGYNQMSAQEQKKFDNGLIKQKKELGRKVDVWDTVDGMLIQPNPSGGIQVIDPSAKKEPNPEIEAAKAQEQIDAVQVEENQKSNTDSVAASQGLKVGGGSVA